MTATHYKAQRNVTKEHIVDREVYKLEQRIARGKKREQDLKVSNHRKDRA